MVSVSAQTTKILVECVADVEIVRAMVVIVILGVAVCRMIAGQVLHRD